MQKSSSKSSIGKFMDNYNSNSVDRITKSKSFIKTEDGEDDNESTMPRPRSNKN
jgi:hypothetical protein